VDETNAWGQGILLRRRLDKERYHAINITPTEAVGIDIRGDVRLVAIVLLAIFLGKPHI